ncbi:MAG: aminotransferase class I/II-fold pyridoxal phosphate-dependent enzyme [Gammaproteobacteria bacterium]|nr:MAG: aminotransferase class I/II-fold pyridoxal phosphate-dependent enzyme [Gammaproteobacteria bacterium]
MIRPNPNVAAMAAYALPDISAAAGLEPIVLAQNEHAWPPSTAVRDAVMQALESGQLYSDSDWTELRAAIAEVHSLDPANIVCGAGSMELMSALLLAYLSSSDRILMTDYGYLFMRTLARLVGAPVDSVAEPDYRVDVDALIGALQPDTRLVFVVNPGNPCGSLLHNDEIRRLRNNLPADVMLLVDEAYAEFVEPDYHEPLFDLIEQGNTVITRTFSKIYGLAGLRVGWGYCPRDIRDQLRKVLNPGSVSSLSQAAARAAMLDQAGAAGARRLIAVQRDYLSAAVTALGLTVIPSQTNFILVDFESAERATSAFEFLRNHRLVVRPMAGYGLPACLRITIGTADQMRLTAQTLGAWRRHNA